MIRDKATMYRLLMGGRLGNTIPQYRSIEEWKASGDHRRYELWGVRSSSRPGHPMCRLNCPAAEVEEHARRYFSDGVNISAMVDALGTRAYLEIWESPLGLVVEGVIRPETWNGWSWRNSMNNPQRRRRWEGSAARRVLESNLNENSLSDLEVLLAEYLDHVVEVSALDRCVGTIPHRNGVVWECRLY